MAEPAPKRRVTYAEYLAAEEAAEGRSQYIRGEVFAMSGGTFEHAWLAMNAATILRNQLRGKPCQPFSADARIRIKAEDSATYPDVSVVCPPYRVEEDDRHAFANPSVLVEVLSPSSEAWDRGGKFEIYRALASLRDYVLVAQDKPRIEHFHRNEDGTWTLRVVGPGQACALESIACVLAVDEVYDGIEVVRGG